MPIVDVEANVVEVTKDGKRFSTPGKGWSMRMVRGSKFWTKTVEGGVVLALNHEDAMAAGVVQERTDPVAVTLGIPSVVSTKFVQNQRHTPKASTTSTTVHDLSEWADAGKQLSREAQRLALKGLSPPSATRAESLRKAFIEKHAAK